MCKNFPGPLTGLHGVDLLQLTETLALLYIGDMYISSTIRVFLGLLDPDPSVRGTVPDHSIIKHEQQEP